MAGLGVDVSLHIALNTIKHCNCTVDRFGHKRMNRLRCENISGWNDKIVTLRNGCISMSQEVEWTKRNESWERERVNHNWISIWFQNTLLDSSSGKKMEFHSTWENWYIMAKSRGESRQITIVNTISSSEIDIISSSGWLHFCSHQSIIVAKLNLWFWWRLNVVLLLNERMDEWERAFHSLNS